MQDARRVTGLLDLFWILSVSVCMVILLITAQSNLSSESRRDRKASGIFSPQNNRDLFNDTELFLWNQTFIFF